MTIRKWLPAILCAVVLSVLLGSAAKNAAQKTGSAPKPATTTTPNIKFTVLPTGKIYIRPKTGDVIQWVDENGRPVHIHFPHKERPCSEPDGKDTCTVTNTTGLYNYSCQTTGGGVICQDPGIDPNSGGDGVSRFRQAAAGASATAPKTMSSKDITAMDIGCDDDGTLSVIDPNNPDPKGNPYPTIDDGSTIQWTTHGMTFSVSSLDPSDACAVISIGSDRVQWCDSVASPPRHPYVVNYKVTVSGTGACAKNNPGTFKFNLK
jgi:hypothetical protein